MSCCATIQVGSIGVVYSVEITADCLAFDIDGADTAELIFQMPNGMILHKTATIVTTGSPPDKWFLEYEVMAGDGVGSPGEFHDNEGPLKVQGYIHFPDGKRFWTSEITTDTDGNELRIFPNLD